MKEKIILEYFINYLKYHEKNVDNEEDLYIFYNLRNILENLIKFNEEQLNILNDTLKKQLEG